MAEGKFPLYKDHLNKTFLEELNYKIWVTKGSRFHASKRLLTKNDWSNKAMGFLSAYLIIISLFIVYQVSRVPILNQNIVAFGSTGISILLLVYGQMEFAQDYKMRSHFYHECALKLAPLYNRMRIFKTLKNTSEDEKERFGRELEEQYQDVLSHYSNHDKIDFRMFQADQAQYYELVKWQVFCIKLDYYWKTCFLYHFLIIGPVFFIVVARYLQK